MLKSVQIGKAIVAATDELVGLVDNPEAFEKKELDICALQKSLERAKKAEAASASLARPHSANTDAGTAGSEVAEKGFDTLGNQLKAIVRHYAGGETSPFLQRAPTGAGETAAESGGFLVQTDFASSIWARAYETGQILQRCGRLPISSNANGIKIPGIDETSRATGSRWGGVQSYWLNEGSAGTPSKPKFRTVEFGLNKLMSLWYVTDELLEDQSALTSIANKAFAEEVTFMVEDAIIRGTGVGLPQGILNSTAKISVAKQTGQAAKTLVYENILAMWSRMWNRSRQDAVWFINQDIEPQLYALSQVIGTAGVPVYLPPNGISGAPYGMLLGRPVIAVEQCDTLGTEGDIILADLSQYMLADKSGVQAASSMHVRFLNDEMVFRITYRIDGKPMWHAPLTPYKGTNTLSPFVTLASR